MPPPTPDQVCLLIEHCRHLSPDQVRLLIEHYRHLSSPRQGRGAPPHCLPYLWWPTQPESQRSSLPLNHMDFHNPLLILSSPVRILPFLMPYLEIWGSGAKYKIGFTIRKCQKISFFTSATIYFIFAQQTWIDSLLQLMPRRIIVYGCSDLTLLRREVETLNRTITLSSWDMVLWRRYDYHRNTYWS